MFNIRYLYSFSCVFLHFVAKNLLMSNSFFFPKIITNVTVNYLTVK